MKQPLKQKSTIYAFLEPFLEHGSEEEIANARKQYYRDYRAQWRREKRQQGMTFEIFFTKQEMQTLQEASARHKRSRSNFIKHACLAYAGQKFLIPEQDAYHAIRELLTQVYHRIKDYEDAEQIPTDSITHMLQFLTSIETRIKNALEFPQPI